MPSQRPSRSTSATSSDINPERRGLTLAVPALITIRAMRPLVLRQAQDELRVQEGWGPPGGPREARDEAGPQVLVFA
jgi:hypothetical protein